MVLGRSGGGGRRRCRRHHRERMAVSAGQGRVVQRRPRESPVYPTADAGKGVVEWRLVMVVVVAELKNELVNKRPFINGAYLWKACMQFMHFRV